MSFRWSQIVLSGSHNCSNPVLKFLMSAVNSEVLNTSQSMPLPSLSVQKLSHQTLQSSTLPAWWQLSLDWRDKARKTIQGKGAGGRMTFSTWQAIAAHLCKLRCLKYKTLNNLVISYSIFELFTSMRVRSWGHKTKIKKQKWKLRYPFM